MTDDLAGRVWASLYRAVEADNRELRRQLAEARRAMGEAVERAKRLDRGYVDQEWEYPGEGDR